MERSSYLNCLQKVKIDILQLNFIKSDEKYVLQNFFSK